ncbi:MAG: asparagine synthetase B, partial [Actinobacteria bacterium]
MCGIAGLYSPTGAPNPELVDSMRAALVHRGPDEGSTDAYGRCVLGHQRLRVIDLETGFQPVTN